MGMISGAKLAQIFVLGAMGLSKASIQPRSRQTENEVKEKGLSPGPFDETG
jgi:hypothetical protein